MLAKPFRHDPKLSGNRTLAGVAWALAHRFVDQLPRRQAAMEVTVTGLFVAFNMLMVSWLIDVVGSLGSMGPGPSAVGAAAGAAIGLAFTLVAWTVGGGLLGVTVLWVRASGQASERLPPLQRAVDSWVPEPRRGALVRSGVTGAKRMPS